MKRRKCTWQPGSGKEPPLLIDTQALMDMLNLGYKSAVELACLAGARVQLGRSVRWNLAKVQSYVNDIASGA